MALIGQLGEHCTGIAEVVGSNPVQSLNFFQVFVSVVLRLHSHLMSLVKTTTFTSLLDSLSSRGVSCTRLNKINMFDVTVTVRAVHV